MARFALFPARRLTAPDQIARIYDRAAASWQSGLERIGFSDAYHVLADRAETYAPSQSALRILDAGTGTGALARAFDAAAQAPRHFDLLDLSPEMLARARDGLPDDTATITGAIGTAEVPEETYDRMLCGHVIEHCDDPQAALNWLATRLVPGGVGIFAISRPHWCTALLRWKWGSAAFRPDDVRRMLETAGFAEIECHPHDTGPPSRVSCGYLARMPREDERRSLP
ncbi:MAG: methyltransferase domain-containing protein [Pseudomonadota bacterium]